MAYTLTKAPPCVPLSLTVDNKGILTHRVLHISRAVSNLDEGTALIATLTDGQTQSLKRLLVDSGLFDIILHNTRFSSVVQFYKEWDEFEPLVAEVLEEAAPHLNVLEHIFCEYHQG